MQIKSTDFQLRMPADITITLPRLSLDALSRLISIPGIELIVDGDMEVSMRVQFGFNITGMSH